MRYATFLSPDALGSQESSAYLHHPASCRLPACRRDRHGPFCRWSVALLVAAALEADVKRLYSEDVPGRPPSGGIEIVNPFA